MSRKGEALQVVRADGTEVVVTVDAADDAAAALNAWADRLYPERSSGSETDT